MLGACSKGGRRMHANGANGQFFTESYKSLGSLNDQGDSLWHKGELVCAFVVLIIAVDAELEQTTKLLLGSRGSKSLAGTTGLLNSNNHASHNRHVDNHTETGGRVAVESLRREVVLLPSYLQLHSSHFFFFFLHRRQNNEHQQV